MTGRLIRMDKYRSGSGGGDMTTRGSGPSTAALLEEAQRDFFDNEGREKKHDRIRACMHVLLSGQERMQEGLREGLEMGGLLRSIPQTQSFPLTTEALTFGTRAELAEFTDEELAAELIARQQEQKMEALSEYRMWASGLLNDLTLIAETRSSGVKPGEILTPESLKLALATEMVSQKMMAGISKSQREVQAIIDDLMNQSEAGVKAVPLAASMRQMGQLCQQMSLDMEMLSETATIATGTLEDDEPRSHSGVVSLAERAQQVFSPFVHGNHVVTMQQIRELDVFLVEAGDYNDNIGALIQDGMRAIQKAKEAGRHREVRKIEEFLGFSDQVAGFERITRALDQNFIARASIVANTGAQNRLVLKSTPPEMLIRAEKESGLNMAHLFGEHAIGDMNLVLPPNDDLKLR